MRKAARGSRPSRGVAALLGVLTLGLFSAGGRTAELTPPVVTAPQKVIGRVDHVDTETLRIVVDDRSFQLSSNTLIRSPNGSPTDLRALRQGLMVEFTPQGTGPRPAVFEIRILPAGYALPPRPQD